MNALKYVILCTIIITIYYNKKLIHANKITVLWDMTPCSSVDRYRHLGKTIWLHLQDGRKVGIYIYIYIYIVTDLINALQGNSSINTVQHNRGNCVFCRSDRRTNRLAG
jgi:hypothetical protein